MNEPTSSPSRLLKASAVAARCLLGLVLAAWLLLALTWGALHGWIVPRIGEFRPQLEIEASRVLGVPVRIGAITAQSTGLIPSFELSEVALFDAQGREALRLPRVLVALSPRSLWHRGFEQVYIDQPELEVRRDAGGKIHVAGLDFASGGGDSRTADWFFTQTEIMLHGGTVRWTDEQRAAPPLMLTQVDFVMRNSARRHGLRLDATPPPEWGERFSLVGQFRQPLLSVHNGRWQDWDGQLYADLPDVDVSQLRRYADPGIDVTEGHGALRLWADVSRGQLAGGTADVALAEVSATLGPQLQPLALASVVGRLGGRLLAGGFEFSTQGLQFQTREGQRWPGGNVFVSWTEGEGQMPAQGELRADRLDLAAVAQIASRLPLGTATHAALAAYAPRGLVETVQASWQGRLGAFSRYAAKGRVLQLEIAARPAAPVPGAAHEQPGGPGVRGADVSFDLTQAGGRLSLALQRGALDLPGVFEDPVVAFEQLSADAQWQIDGEKIGVQLSNVKFANADAEGQAQLSWRTSDPAVSGARSRFPGVLDAQASMSRANGARVYRYLPMALPPAVRDYVRNAVVQGSATGVKFRVKGDLHDIPFSDPKQGDFRISANVQDATFAFAPRSLPSRYTATWPVLTQLSGELVFDHATMQVKGASGRFAGAPGLQVTRAEAQIPDLAHSTTVVVSADARGPLGEMLGIVSASPLGAMTGQVLARATATGNADLRLRLNLPVHAIDRAEVQGSVTLAGNDLQVTPDSPVLGRARGVVNFTESSFTVSGAQMRLLGGDMRLDGGTRAAVAGAAADASPVFRVQGTVTADGLRQARELGFLSRLAQSASGSTAYNAVLGFRRGIPELSVTSNLQGLALNLPSPLSKSADAPLPLRFDNLLVRDSPVSGSGGQARLQDQWSLDLGRIASITYVRDLGGAEPRVIRGGIGIGLAAGESAPLPDEGVAANVNLASVDIDAWEAVLSGAAGTSVAAAAGAAPAARPGGAASAALGYLPTSLAVRARELTVEGRKLNNVVIGGSRDGLTWRANVDASELNGYVEYRQPAGAGGGRVYARLARLAIAQSAANDMEALLDEQPVNLPALDVVVDDFELRGKKLGRVEVDAVNRGGGAREWRLNKLNLALPEASLTATGNWTAINAQAAPPGGARAAGERRRTVMNFRLDVGDSGELLSRFGMKGVIRGGKGRLEGQVAWAGSPLALDYPSMSGQFNVNMESGQFLKADPGLAKLLGVLSLQSLPRRLTLDFRDVFSEGFAFDFIRGDVRIDQGIALTNNLQMKGVNAAVLMDGRADIGKETQDLKVVIVPEINAGTASLVATAINPAVGLGTFLAQLFLRRPLMQAATQEFHIDGTWTDPKITKVEHRPAADGKGANPP
jgi:uncharacterized protein (TIGR02099 family)